MRWGLAVVAAAYLFWWPPAAEGQGGGPKTDTSQTDRGSATNDKLEQTQEVPLPRFLRPEWVITYITAVYTIFAALTLWAMNRQAKLLGRQVSLQEAAMSPWADVNNWKVVPLDSNEGTTTLAVSFELINGSEFPCTTNGFITFFRTSTEAATNSIAGLSLLPRRPTKVITFLVLGPERKCEYECGNLTIPVQGEVRHLRAPLKVGNTSTIHGNLFCGRTSQTKMEFQVNSILQDNSAASGTEHPADVRGQV